MVPQTAQKANQAPASSAGSHILCPIMDLLPSSSLTFTAWCLNHKCILHQASPGRLHPRSSCDFQKLLHFQHLERDQMFVLACHRVNGDHVNRVLALLSHNNLALWWPSPAGAQPSWHWWPSGQPCSPATSWFPDHISVFGFPLLFNKLRWWGIPLFTIFPGELLDVCSSWEGLQNK